MACRLLDAIIRTNVWQMLIGPFGTDFSKILIKISLLSVNKMYFKCCLQNVSHTASASMCHMQDIAIFSAMSPTYWFSKRLHVILFLLLWLHAYIQTVFFIAHVVLSLFWKKEYSRVFHHGPFIRYVKVRVAHAPERRERFPCHRLQRKPLVSDPVMHHGTCVTHVPRCMSRSLTGGGGVNVPGIPGACTIRNFTYQVRGPFPSTNILQVAELIP